MSLHEKYIIKTHIISESCRISVSKKPVPYDDAIQYMDAMHHQIKNHLVPECVHIWFLEHPSLYTAGTSAKDKDLLNTKNFPVYHAGRGGQYTYHGPGQLIAYVVADLNRLGLSVSSYVKVLEYWIIDVLAYFNIHGFLSPERIGVWVQSSQNRPEEKIAAIGVRVKNGITLHGLSFNIAPNLDHFKGIVPCGLADFGVTSLQKMGGNYTFDQVICVFENTIPLDFLEKKAIL